MPSQMMKVFLDGKLIEDLGVLKTGDKVVIDATPNASESDDAVQRQEWMASLLDVEILVLKGIQVDFPSTFLMEMLKIGAT